ncbi:hypothetical protein OKW43_002964 [Paraburkholderia sp. WC7.3g]|uniref:hypothetical protein n=1 Tax=Paraburkholderia sp. WC7.3g TaxID=2991070 RepID=UPI003D242508
MFALGFIVKQIDTHVKGSLTECELDAVGNLIQQKVILDCIVLPKEVFLYFVQRKAIVIRAIRKDPNFVAFDDYFNSLVKPGRRKIAGEYKGALDRYRLGYDIQISVLAVDRTYSKIELSTAGCFNYRLAPMVLRKDVLENLVWQINAKVSFPDIWSDIRHRLERIRPKLSRSTLFSPWRATTLNAIQLILESPVTVLFSNALKMLAPTIEGVLGAYITHKGVKGIKTQTLSTIVGGLANHTGSEFSPEFKEYVRIILEPIRNMLLHGKIPSESVCNFLIVICCDLFEEILDSE